MNLSEIERIELLIIVGFGDRKRTHSEACDVFNDNHPNRPPISRSTVSRTVQRFDELKTVKNRSVLGRPKTTTNDDISLQVLLDVTETPQTSVRQLAVDHDVCEGSIRKILKKSKLHPYKPHLVHELLEDDFDRRLQFAEIIMERTDADQNFARNIVFSDEATFMLNGSVNRHNCRYWHSDNPHVKLEIHTQFPKKLNVWCGILNGNVIGPFFIHGTLSSVSYLQLLQNQIIPKIKEIKPNPLNPQALHQDVWYQQDGAPAHFGQQVRAFLNFTFPGQWIGRRGAIEWPPRSPDMTPMDFFFWGYLKSVVYRDRPTTLNELEARIRIAIANIPPAYLQNSLGAFVDRLRYCQEVNGQQFEHLL